MRVITLGVLLVAAALACVPATVDAKRYLLEKIAIDAEVRDDGTLAVEERITYRFYGSFSYAYRTIPLRGGENIKDIKVSEGGRQYRPAGDRTPGTYAITSTSTGVKVTWYYRCEERMVFEFAYVMEGVVKRYRDVAELYHQFVGGGWEQPFHKVEVKVRVPRGVDRSELRAWAHGPRLLNGTVTINPDATVSLDVVRLPDNTYWEGRILFPSDALPNVALYSDTDRLEKVMNEERAWADHANQLRQANLERQEARRARREALQKRARTYLPLSLVASMLGVLLWFRAFRRHGWPHQVTSRAAPGEIPSDHRPAMVSYLMFRNVGATAIVATLIDLADRGYFTIREMVREKRGFFGRTREETDYRFERTKKLWADLDSYELELAEFLITEVGDVTGFNMSDLKQTARKDRSRFLRWFRDWVKKVREEGKKLNMFEPYPVRAMVSNALVGAAVCASGAFFSLNSASAVGLPAVVTGAIVMILTATLNRRTVEGRRLLLAWRGFQSHLKSISKALGPVSLNSSDWSRYLSAAIIFGLHKKLLSKLTLVDDRGAAAYPVWYHGVFGSSSGDGLGSLADGLTSMVTSMSTTVSSASGTGGGASVGGGGGSGGGGGGAG